MLINLNRAAFAAIGLLTSAAIAVPSANADGSLKDTPEISTVVWTGIDKSVGSFAEYSGFITALNGDISATGFLIRADGLYVHTSDGQVWEGSPLVGYQVVQNGTTYSGFIGPDFRKLPDSSVTTVRGYETGLKVRGSVETDDAAEFAGNIHAEYSTAFNSYWARARVGYNLKGFLFGPEGTLIGDDSFRAQRAGAFLTIPLAELGHSTELTVAGGYQWVQGFDSTNILGPMALPVSTVGQSGGYVTVGFSFLF
jgi:Cellulose biosynthesis protein BcsS